MLGNIWYVSKSTQRSWRGGFLIQEDGATVFWDFQNFVQHCYSVIWAAGLPAGPPHGCCHPCRNLPAHPLRCTDRTRCLGTASHSPAPSHRRNYCLHKGCKLVARKCCKILNSLPTFKNQVVSQREIQISRHSWKIRSGDSCSPKDRLGQGWGEASEALFSNPEPKGAPQNTHHPDKYYINAIF